MNLEKNVLSLPCASDACTPGTIRKSSEMRAWIYLLQMIKLAAP